jgi:hypothetical protein
MQNRVRGFRDGGMRAGPITDLDLARRLLTR